MKKVLKRLAPIFEVSAAGIVQPKVLDRLVWKLWLGWRIYYKSRRLGGQNSSLVAHSWRKRQKHEASRYR